MRELSERIGLIAAAAVLLILASECAGSDFTIRLGEPVPVPDNQGDTWVATWAEDGGLYSPCNDTQGFRSAGSANIGFVRLLGDDPLKLTGETVNLMADYGTLAKEGPDRCSWKSSGCSAIDGVIYWVVARHQYGEKSGDPRRRQIAANASIIKSKDRGKTWTRSVKENYDAPMFPGRRFATPYFIQYGQDGRGAVDHADRFVYALSNNGFWDSGDNLILGRVARSRIGDLQASDWRYYTGGDGLEEGAWSHDMSRAKLVLEDPGKLGMTGAVHIPALNRYLMIGWYYPAGGGVMPGAAKESVWDFYEAPKPWGPWSRVSTHRFSPQGYYCPQICPRFTSGDGTRLFVVTAGDWNNRAYYRLTVVPVVLERGPARQKSAQACEFQELLIGHPFADAE